MPNRASLPAPMDAVTDAAAANTLPEQARRTGGMNLHCETQRGALDTLLRRPRLLNKTSSAKSTTRPRADNIYRRQLSS